MTYSYDHRMKSAAIIWTETSTTYEVSGAYQDLREKLSKLKSQGWGWDGRKWSILKESLSVRQVANIKKVLGIGERGLPDAGVFEEVVSAMKPYGRRLPSGGLLLPPMGVDFRAYGMKWVEKMGWTLSPDIDSAGFRRDLPKILEGAREVERKTGELSRLRSTPTLGVGVEDGMVYLRGPGTFEIKDDLKGLKFNFSNRAWSRKVHGLDVSALEKLIERETSKAPSQERREPQGATEAQVELLKKLVRQNSGDWYDITDGMGSGKPPSEFEIRRMTREQVSGLIELVLDWKRGAFYE